MSEQMIPADPWPFTRQDPDCIVLPVRTGHDPSGKPPVRIFLGTEEAQYRAERIFFYSIEKFRDPSRVYEVYLMKNIRGIDRRKWRTGFTNYRYAIPSFAGGEGRAIYNDVDQIYLADPALLFDLDMGRHGYMAISAKDTSVMVMDCAAMLRVWNRETAGKLGKHELINKPSQTPGLWGELDGHWNARDQEYVEGRTKCLHYTALHQQPWEPFPDDFSYHPNPLAYIWHDLEHEADAAGFQLFTESAPSPDFARVVSAATGAGAAEFPASGMALDLLGELDVRDAIIAHAPHASPSTSLPEVVDAIELSVDTSTEWPEKGADCVLADGLLYDVPPADLPWILSRLFGAARKLVYFRLGKSEPVGMGSVAWWERRIREAARSHPQINWQLEALDASSDLPRTITTIQVKKRQKGNPVIWSFQTRCPKLDQGVEDLVEPLGVRPLVIGSDDPVPSGVPDMVIVGDRNGADRAISLKRKTGHDFGAVQIGHTGASPKQFDLVVSTPDERIPIRPNVQHIPLPPIAARAGAKSGALWLLAKPGKGYKLGSGDIEAMRKFFANLDGPHRIWIDPAIDEETRKLAQSGMEADDVSSEPQEAVIAAASRVLLTLDQRDAIALAARAGTHVDLARLKPWHSSIPGAKQVIQLATLIMGGGNSYRGTPHQQHFIARAIDERVIKRGWRLPGDLNRLHRALVGRGLASWIDAAEIVSSPKALDDKAMIEQRLRELLSERTIRQSVRAA